MQHANEIYKGPKWSPGFITGRNGELGRSVSVECEGGWQH